MVLIVDDEIEIRRLLSVQLKREGFRVYSAESGEKALELLQNGLHVDALVSDIRMPGGIDGVELIRHLNKDNIRLPVNILMSGHAILHPQEIEELRIDRCLSKPFSVKKLSLILRDCLENHSNQGPAARKFPRTQEKLAVKETRQEVEIEQTFDLSVGGVFIQSQAPLQVGQRFKVQIDLQPPLMVELEVKWLRSKPQKNKPAGVGCEFVNLAEADAERLREYLASKTDQAESLS